MNAAPKMLIMTCRSMPSMAADLRQWDVGSKCGVLHAGSPTASRHVRVAQGTSRGSDTVRL